MKDNLNNCPKKETLNNKFDDPESEIIKLKGDSSSKKIYRQIYPDDRTSIIIDFTEVEGQTTEYFFENKVYFATQYELFREINHYLYQNIPHDIGCRVGRIFGTSDFGKSILMEDFGSTALLDHGYRFTIYKNLIRWLGHLDKLYLNDKDLNYFIKDRRYETKAITAELNDFIQHSDEDLADLVEELLKKAKEIPISICHRDFQPLNIMIHDDKPRIIDTQDTCLGPLTYDLACLLYDPLLVLDKEEIKTLMMIYSFIVDADYKEIKKWTKTCAQIRLIKSAGRHYGLYKKTNDKEHFERAKKAFDYLVKEFDF